MEEGRRHGVEKFVAIGTVCASLACISRAPPY